MVNRLLVINVAVYLLISIAGIFTFLFGYLGLAESVGNNILALPAAPGKLLWRFWTPIT